MRYKFDLDLKIQVPAMTTDFIKIDGLTMAANLGSVPLTVWFFGDDIWRKLDPLIVPDIKFVL